MGMNGKIFLGALSIITASIAQPSFALECVKLEFAEIQAMSRQQLRNHYCLQGQIVSQMTNLIPTVSGSEMSKLQNSMMSCVNELRRAREMSMQKFKVNLDENSCKK